jgi:hypothetical protein
VTLDSLAGRSLEGREIAVSVSEPDADELAARGVSELHVSHAFREIVRQLFAAGATIGYGGDFRARGFMHKLIAVLNEYSGSERPPSERWHHYLAWPLWEQADVEELAELNLLATVEHMPPPPGAPADASAFDGDTSPAARAIRAEALTAMRERMNASMTARVILGGRLTGHKSRFPGVVEEAYIAARTGKPVYVLGGFGGCASCIAQVLDGGRPPALTLEHQRDHTKGYRELLDGLGESIDYEDMLRTLQALDRIRNGLDDDDNAELRKSADLDLVVALVLRGLREL